MPPVSHKPIETTQFFQDRGELPHLCRSGCNWRTGVTGRSPEVTWGYLRSNDVTIRFFADKSRQDGDRDALIVPDDLARRAASGIWIFTYLGHDLNLTWPDLRSTLQIDLSRSDSAYFERAGRGKHNGVIIFLRISYITKVLMKNNSREKQ